MNKEIAVYIKREPSTGKLTSTVGPYPEKRYAASHSLTVDRQGRQPLDAETVIHRAQWLAAILEVRYIEDKRWHCVAKDLGKCICPRCQGAPDVPDIPDPVPMRVERASISSTTKVEPWDEPERDNCQVCRGFRGGVRGNEQWVEGVLMCDYCHSTYMELRDLIFRKAAEPINPDAHADGCRWQPYERRWVCTPECPELDEPGKTLRDQRDECEERLDSEL